MDTESSETRFLNQAISKIRNSRARGFNLIRKTAGISPRNFALRSCTKLRLPAKHCG